MCSYKKRLGPFDPQYLLTPVTSITHKGFGQNIGLNMAKVYLEMFWYQSKVEKVFLVNHYSTLNGPRL
jgi:hypothetical protein